MNVYAIKVSHAGYMKQVYQVVAKSADAAMKRALMLAKNDGLRNPDIAELVCHGRAHCVR